MRPFKKKNRIDKIIINSLIVAAILVAISGPIREIYIFALKLISSFNHSVSEKTNFQFEKIVNSSHLIKEQSIEIKNLDSSLKSCEAQLRETRLIARKVLAIDSLLQIKRNYFPESVAAKIIARSPSSWHQEIIIDKGRLDNIKPGMVTITEKGILGQIQDAKPDYAIVQLMSSSQIRFGVIVRRVGVMGILFGDKGGYAQLKFIPIGSDIKKGDIVQTSGISPNGIEKFFPIDYPVGKVIEVSKDDNNSEMFIRVKLFEDGYRISSRAVLVLMPWGNKASLEALQKISFEETKPVSVTPKKNEVSKTSEEPKKIETIQAKPKVATIPKLKPLTKPSPSVNISVPIVQPEQNRSNSPTDAETNTEQ